MILPLLAVVPATGRAASLIEPGYVLRVEVLNAPDLSREAMVDTDGRIMLPMLGGVEVVGQNVDEIRQRITTELADRDLMHSATVLVEIAAYRPIYIGGAVETPRSIDYTPGLTVRQAIMVAGGLRSPLEEDDKPEALVGIVSEARSAAFALLQMRARIARIKAELAGRDEVVLSFGAPSEVPREERERVLQLEREVLAENRSRDAGVDVHKQAVLDLLELELEVLTEQAVLQDEEATLQAEEVANARSLVERGLMPRNALQELLREKSQLSRDILTNETYSARARQAKETTVFELDDQRSAARVTLHGQLQEAERERVRLESELKSLRARLLAAGVRLTGDERSEDPTPEVTIHRSVDGKAVSIEAIIDAPVEPGDVLDVKLSDVALGSG